MAYQQDRITGIPSPLPADYDRQANFTDWEIQQPGEPPRGVDLDAEFNAVEQAVDETQARLRLIQRDDGAVANNSIGFDQLTNEARIGVEAPVAWEPFTRFGVNNSVIVDEGAWYIARESHVSAATFQEDLDAGKWVLLIDLTPYTTEAKNWATLPEDQPVPEGDGTEYSAEHHAAKALASEIAAELARDEAQTAEQGAVNARNDAQTARDTTLAARDTTLAARDTTLSARDTTLSAQTDFTNKWQGLYATPPTTRPDSTALEEGDAYTDSNTGAINLYLSGAWDAVTNYVRRTSITGAAVVPAGTEAQRDTTAQAGYLRFNSDTGLYEGFNGSEWVAVGAGATGSAGDQVFVENDQIVTADYTIPSDKNASTTGPIRVADDAIVTVSDSSNWVIL